MDGRWGFYAAQSHEVVDIESCPLCHPNLNAALTKLRQSPLGGEIEVLANTESDEVLVWTEEPSEELQEDFPLAQSLEDEGPRHQFMVDDVPVNQVSQWEEAFLQFMRERRSDVWKMVDENKDKGDAFKKDDDETTNAVMAAIEEFNRQYKPRAAEEAA